MTGLTPLEPWISTRIGMAPGQRLTRPALEEYQLARLVETVEYVRQRSPFYRQRMAKCALPAALDDLERLPFTTPADIQDDDSRFLCVSRQEVERVVTLRSSGTTAPSKRLHFTANDLELTVDFFHHGMATMVQPGQRVLVLMPGELPGSVGDLLVKGLARLGVRGIVHGLVRDVDAALEEIINQRIDCIVGLPVQVLSLVRHPHALRVPPGQLRSILLSADYVPDAIVAELSMLWDVPVFNHYGMTEMGLGGGVECACRCGYHLREADLIWEVVDPQDGRRLAAGEVGEVVFTTLTRRGMPLIRYRTGDLARFLPDPCPCGTILQRMERVSGRISARVMLSGGELLGMSQLDEALFSLPFMLNFQPILSSSCVREVLELNIATIGLTPREAVRPIGAALLEIPAIREAVAAGRLTLGRIAEGQLNPLSGSIKRGIEDRRKEPT